MQYNQRGTKFSHIYAHQSINLFLYVIKAHATENKLRLYGKNWSTLLSQSNSVRHLLPFAFFVVSLLPVLTRDRKIIEHPLKTTTKSKNISIARGQFLVIYYIIK